MRDNCKAMARALLALALTLSWHTAETFAQQAGAANSAPSSTSAPADGARKDGNKPADASPSMEDRLRALEQIVERQQTEIKSLRQLLETRDRESASATPAAGAPAAAVSAAATLAETAPPKPAEVARQAAQPEATQKKVDDLYKKFGAIRFSGDLRFRAESFNNQGFDSPTEAADRLRLRIRARLALDGVINPHFDWGFRLASGSFTDPISTNQTLTDFYERKPFALERAFIRYDSKGETTGVQLVAGKFEPTFRRTQMVWDDDVNVEGASEALYFKTRTSLSQVKLVAFQLPFNEVSGGKDGILYGGQVQTDWKWASTVSANVNLAYYDWNRADQVLQSLVNSANTANSANLVNGFLSNGAGVSGNQNGALGTTNRLIRDAAGRPTGFLANFHLFDVLGNLTWQARPRLPVTFTFDYVRNMSSRIRDEKEGYWAGAQVGQAREKGDYLFGYFYTRIEQDAVLVPFNFSDILASNSRAHMPTAGFQLADSVTLQWTGLFSQRVNTVAPLSPFNRYLKRMQFDVVYKF